MNLHQWPVFSYLSSHRTVSSCRGGLLHKWVHKCNIRCLAIGNGLSVSVCVCVWLYNGLVAVLSVLHPHLSVLLQLGLNTVFILLKDCQHSSAVLVKAPVSQSYRQWKSKVNEQVEKTLSLKFDNERKGGNRKVWNKRPQQEELRC